MAELFAMALEMRRDIVMKTEPVDASDPLSNTYSHAARSKASVDVESSVAAIRQATVAKGETNCKRKHVVDTLMRNQACLLEIVADLVESRD